MNRSAWTSGMGLAWSRTTLLEAGMVSAGDLDLLTVPDDEQQVIDIMCQHRDWKRKQIEKAACSIRE